MFVEVLYFKTVGMSVLIKMLSISVAGLYQNSHL